MCITGLWARQGKEEETGSVCEYCERAGEEREKLDTWREGIHGRRLAFEWNAQQEEMAQPEAQQGAETQRQIKMEAGNLRG